MNGYDGGYDGGRATQKNKAEYLAPDATAGVRRARLKNVNFIHQRRDVMDLRMDDQWTHPLIEMCSRILKPYYELLCKGNNDKKKMLCETKFYVDETTTTTTTKQKKPLSHVLVNFYRNSH